MPKELRYSYGMKDMNYAMQGAFTVFCLFIASGCDKHSESSNVLENYTRVPYEEGQYIDNDAYYLPPNSYYGKDLELDPD